MFPKPTRIKDKPYIEWIKKLRCCVNGKPDPDPHHVNDKSGGSAKFNDRRAIPLNHPLHVELHNIGAETFAARYGLDYEAIIEELNRRYDEAQKTAR